MKNYFGFLFVIISICTKSQDFSEYRSAYYSSEEGRLPYRILYPIDFDSTKSYPVIVFLHGAFEKGTDNNAQLNIGGRFFLREENRKNFPAFVIFPQCPGNDSWVYFDTKIDSATGLAKEWDFPFLKKPTAPSALLRKLLDSLLTLRFMDHKRIYIGGLSQGAMGVFDIVARYPELFAAGFPICGAGKISTARNFAGKTSLWIFHGEKDNVVPVDFSRNYYNRLKKLGADVKYTEYPAVFHNSWVNAFGEKDLLLWLFSKAKK